jgi:inorganic pyrophosphatase
LANGGTLMKAGPYEIDRYKIPQDPQLLRRSHVPYVGSPRKHPHDPEKVILVSPHTHSYFEFRVADVTYMERGPNLVDLDGQAIPMARLWVQRGSLAIHCWPFVVEDTAELNTVEAACRMPGQREVG